MFAFDACGKNPVRILKKSLFGYVRQKNVARMKFTPHPSIIWSAPSGGSRGGESVLILSF